jgi:hypothetical protein
MAVRRTLIGRRDIACIEDGRRGAAGSDTGQPAGDKAPVMMGKILGLPGRAIRFVLALRLMLHVAMVGVEGNVFFPGSG